MHDMDVGSEELTAFASAIQNSSALKSSLQTLHLRSVNVDPAMWALPLAAFASLSGLQAVDLSYNTLARHGCHVQALLTQCSTSLTSVNLEQCDLGAIEKHVVAGLTACAEAGRLQRLSVADNVFTRGFLGAFMQIMAGLDLHMLNLRFVCEQDSNDRSTALEFDKLVVRHLHLDFSTLILDTTFLASMVKAVAHPACVLETLEMPSMRHPADASLMELMTQVATYGRIRRLNLRGLSHVPLWGWESILYRGIKQCAVLEWTVRDAFAAQCIALLQTAHAPALKEMHMSVESSSESSSSRIVSQAQEWRQALAVALPRLTKLEFVAID
ncbi:hypothetical protein H257_07692 [Aphanomyces astaci]|uniref:Uncharacterized protein n=1 Tax=Aphanomyces astaci TaxID=112090 RepID=W4GGS0_APHAT|nr:hypothetical protein H257_07692 [Aphanomyces astaci]ETV78885.1 hypothetical protein H257_07692 [Aphanomyces astaci]|eukprot:XP_009831604.1 hypothetical protein H257_07692 [Aphanomyces astaci]